MYIIMLEGLPTFVEKKTLLNPNKFTFVLLVFALEMSQGYQYNVDK